MRPKLKLCFRTFLGLICLFIYCEYIIYFVILTDCGWPELNRSKEDVHIKAGNEMPVKAMILADTHLLGSRKGHWLDKLRREWQMHRAFQTAMFLHKPDVVFVLGDLTDEGLYCSNAEFDYYVKRFYDLFAVPEGTQLFVAVGNHDIGFHYGISPYLNQRFVTGFKSPAVQLITIRDNHFVLVNSMAMEGDGCFLCNPAEQELGKIEKILKCSQGVVNCDPELKLDRYSRPILMQHYPLYRPSDMECNDFDAAPLSIKQERFREKWECLSKEATDQLLNQIKPRLAFSGHTHHGCTRPLSNGDGIEYTIPSFSWRNKANPNYGLAVFTPNNYAFLKCEMPNEYSVIHLYVVGCTGLLIWLLFALYKNMRARRKCRRL